MCRGRERRCVGGGRGSVGEGRGGVWVEGEEMCSWREGRRVWVEGGEVCRGGVWVEGEEVHMDILKFNFQYYTYRIALGCGLTCSLPASSLCYRRYHSQ